MVLVLLQHAFLACDLSTLPGDIALVVWYSTYLAAIGFVSIAGAMCGYRMRPGMTFPEIYKRVVMKSVLVLVGAHFAINASDYWFTRQVLDANGEPRSTFEILVLGFPITDTIGVCLLIYPLVAVSLSHRMQVCMAILMHAFPQFWLGLADPLFTSVAVEAMIGRIGEPRWFWWPLLPWLAVFILGGVVGSKLPGYLGDAESLRRLSRDAIRWGLVLFLASMLSVSCYWALRHVVDFPNTSVELRALYPRQTTGLMPGYLAVLCWMFAALQWRESYGERRGAWEWWLSVFGRTSLFVFVVQFFVVESIPAMFGWTGHLDWLQATTLFVLSAATMWSIGFGYGRIRGTIRDKDREDFTMSRAVEPERG